MKRAVAWCMNEECPEYAKGVFLLNSVQHKCKCDTMCLVVAEHAKILNDSKEFREVRVDYNYDPIMGKYRELAIVRDEGASQDANVLSLFSPLIKTDKRALRVAESYLAQMTLTPATKGDDVPPVRETTINFDREIDSVRKELEELHYRLHYAQAGKLPKSS